ncbi:MAG TPA: hypothetical protein VMW54_00160 [Terriglobia bacterium]|nr:hypothetical protein [Terriglobia bacterium]
MKSKIKSLGLALVAASVFPALMAAQTGNNQKPGTPGKSTTIASNVPAMEGAATHTAAAKAYKGLLLQAGSSLHVRLQTTLTSKTNKTGDKFTGFVEKPVTTNGKVIVPRGSLVDGHVVFIKKAKRIKGVGQMRIVLDDITTENGAEFLLNGTLEDAQGSPCAKSGNDDEGTIKGCGKSAKSALKGAAIAGAMGAGAGATVGMGHEIDCRYYGNCGGPGFGTDIGYGAAIGAGAALVYNIFKHEKALVLLQGTHLTFVVDRNVAAREMPPAANPIVDVNTADSN